MTLHGETDNLSCEGHVRVLVEHTHPSIIDACIVNTGEIPAEYVDRYRKQESDIAELDSEKIEVQGYEVIKGDVVKYDEVVRHDSSKLASVIIEAFEARERLKEKEGDDQ